MKTLFLPAFCLAITGCAQLLDGDHDYVLGGSGGAHTTTSTGGTTSTTSHSGGAGGATTTTTTTSVILCNAPEVLCGGACIPVAVDPANCGYCDHDCRGAPCADGLCQPTELVSDVCYPDTLAVDLTHVYFSTEGNDQCDTMNGTVQRLSKTGGTPPDILSTSVGIACSLRLFEGHVYWADRKARVLQRCPKNGNGGTATLSEQYAYLERIDVSALGVYFAMSWSDIDGSGPGAIGQVPLTGGPTTWIAQNLSRPHFLTLTSDRIYFDGTIPENNGLPENGYVASVPVNGGLLKKHADQQQSPQGIVIDSDAIYWTVDKDKAIRKMTLPNGPVETLATGQEDVHTLEQDETHLYWTTLTGGVIARVAKTGGDVEILASGRERPFAIDVDSQHVYWSESIPAGRIMRVPK